MENSLCIVKVLKLSVVGYQIFKIFKNQAGHSNQPLFPGAVLSINFFGAN